MGKRFKVGDRVMFCASMRYRGLKQSFEVETGDLGTVSDTQYPSEWFVTVTLDKQPDRPVTVPSDIVDGIPEPKSEPCSTCEDGECECCGGLTPPSGFILLHDDATGEAVMYRASIVDAIGDGYIVLNDGTEFDCEESVENIARQISGVILDGWMP